MQRTVETSTVEVHTAYIDVSQEEYDRLVDAYKAVTSGFAHDQFYRLSINGWQIGELRMVQDA